jgi:signal transduction histidine kinase
VKVVKAKAEDANEAKSAFLSTVSHELRTPLTSVLGFAKIIRKRLEENIFPAVTVQDQKIKPTMKQVSENLNVVVSEGERLTNLINDVLGLAKIEFAKIEWNMRPVFLQDVIHLGMQNGKLIMGIAGDIKRLDAAIISDTVNTTARVEGLSKHYGTSILLTKECKDDLTHPDEFDFRYLGLV